MPINNILAEVKSRTSELLVKLDELKKTECSPALFIAIKDIYDTALDMKQKCSVASHPGITVRCHSIIDTVLDNLMLETHRIILKCSPSQVASKLAGDSNTSLFNKVDQIMDIHQVCSSIMEYECDKIWNILEAMRGEDGKSKS